MKRKTIIVIIAILIVTVGSYILRDKWFPLFFLPQGSPDALKGSNLSDVSEEVVVSDLEIPWEIAFLPDGDILITERPGRLVSVGWETKVIPIEGVRHIGEGGLLGMTVHPEFEDNGWIYLYMTFDGERGLENKVERYILRDGFLSDRSVIIDGIPGSRFHNGGRIDFGPDGYLYITTGDGQEPELAQDIGSLAGKILRIGGDGSVPEGNPFGNEVYSLGHRNPQGIAWDEEGRLWSTEHGPGARDEINMIEPGKNYGWPVITGNESEEGMETPFINSGVDHTWAPAGMAHVEGRLFFGGLRGQALYELVSDRGTLKEYFKEEIGRIRVVRFGPDGSLYIGTSNRDGRGFEKAGDDKIIRLKGGLSNPRDTDY